MKAIILAAGKGTRLKVLTQNRPKALVPLNGTPMLGALILKLKSQGFHHLLINIHHFGDLIIDYVVQNKNFGIDIRFSDERNQLLDTGGAILQAASFFRGEEPVLVHNVDILSDIDLHQLMETFKKTAAIAGLVVQKRDTKRRLLFNKEHKLVGWTNSATRETKWVNAPLQNPQPFAFSGIWIAHPRFVENIPFSGRFSIIDAWIKIAQSETILGLIENNAQWHDLGTIERIEKAEI